MDCDTVLKYNFNVKTSWEVFSMFLLKDIESYAVENK